MNKLFPLVAPLDMDTDPPENSAPMINSDLMIVDWEDIFCSLPRYCGKDLHGMMDTDSSETYGHSRSGILYVSDCGSGPPMVGYGR